MNDPAHPHRNEIKPIRPSSLTVVIVHGILLAILGFFIMFVIPVFGEMYCDFGAPLPKFTQFIFDLSFLFKRYFFFLPLIALVLWFDKIIYEHLYRIYGRRGGLIWFWGWIGLLILLIFLSVWGLFLPVGGLGEVVGG